MSQRTGAVIGLGIIAGTLAFSAASFKKSLVNYVSFAEARKATDTSVQILAPPVPGTLNYDSMEHALHFTLKSGNGDVMPVVFKGPKPEDLDGAMSKAASIGAVGTYDPQGGVFVAESLLVKCPSKYQGTTERSYGAS